MRTSFASVLPTLLLLHACTAGSTQAPLADAPSNYVAGDTDHQEYLFAPGETDPRAISPRVQNAWDTLRTIKPATSPTDKPSGLLGYTLHYGREAFRILFMNGPATGKSDRKTSSTVARAVEELKAAADEDEDPDAIFLLAEMNFYGNFTHPRNFSEAFMWYSDLAWLDGNSTAQSMVGFMYATGIGNAVERDQAKALMYHEFAAEGGNTQSEMTLAYRYHTGIGTPKDCEHAVAYYKRVADKAMDYYRSGPPGGHAMVRESYRWADEEGGVYGEGASVSSSGPNAKDHNKATQESSVEDVLEFLDLMSRKGQLSATFSLGKMNYEGARGLPRNFHKAMKYFRLITAKYWKKDGTITQNPPAGLDKVAAKAAGHIGLMFLRGEGVKQDFSHALLWFKRGMENGDDLCQHHVGLMYLHGYGVPQDAWKASNYFKSAAEQDYPAAETRLGALFLDQGDVATAARYFDIAARHGWMEAYYYLAEMANFGVGRQRHCGVAAAYYKMVSEKAEEMHSAIAESNMAYEAGDKEGALVPTMMAAEQGYENAQANVAYLLDEQRSLLSLNGILPWLHQARSSLLRNTALALIYWTRSAKQANIDSLIKMGDYYLAGTGAVSDAEKASTCYHNAAEAHHSAQAYWNLGWMHENGVAVAQDFHMAKRYYDLALETNKEAYLPVKLSLLKLRARGYWNRITNGDINPIRDDEEAKPRRTFTEWLSAFIENDEAAYYQELYEAHADDEDFMRTRGLESDHEDGYYDDLEFDIDEGMLEGLLIVGLAATLLVLVYIRQQQQRNRQNQNAANQANANGNANANVNANANADPATQNATQPASPVQTNRFQEKAATTPKFSPVVHRQNPGSIGLTTPTRSSADPELLDLQKQQVSLQSRITALRTDRDTIHQALRIESSNKDLELEALIIKWRRAGQDAAEEVFSNAQERVTRMGGIAAWMERSKRDAVRWDDQEPQAHNQKSDLSPQDEETPDEEFTMGFMLKTLNIEPKTIGYDPTMGKWIHDL